MTDKLLTDFLEAGARPLAGQHLAGDRVDGRVLDLTATFSTAISLKRIADSLESIAGQLDGSAKGMNLWDFASQAATLVNDRLIGSR